jgi:hypothetical protein
MLPTPSIVLFIFSTFQPMLVFNPMKQLITLPKHMQIHSQIPNNLNSILNYLHYKWHSTIIFSSNGLTQSPFLVHNTTFVASNAHISNVVDHFHVLFNAFFLDGMSVKLKVLVSIHED